MDLSKIKDTKLKNEILRIARLDGESIKNASVNKSNEYKELCNLLNGSYTRELEQDEKDVLMGLKIEYETTSKNLQQNINKNSKNKISNVNGNCIIGDNNAVGGDNSINISGNDNTVIIVQSQEEANEIIETKTENKRPTIDSVNEEDGALYATDIYNEVNSGYALNNVIKTACSGVGKLTAYSFFKEYKVLNNGRSRLMQDIYGVSDIFNRIDGIQAGNLISALLSQAKNLKSGLENTDAYNNLQKHLKRINQSGNKDPSEEEAIKLDKAVDLLLQEMAKIYGDK